MKKIILALLVFSQMSFADDTTKAIDDLIKDFHLTDKEAKILRDTQKINTFLQAKLGHAKSVDESGYTIYTGVTKKGESCKVIDASTFSLVYLEMLEHPNLPESHSQTREYSFSWDYSEMTNILGIEVKPDFSISEKKMEASVTVVAGHGIARYGLKVSEEKERVVLSIRNRGRVLTKSIECLF